ncbi:hypothetical protein MTO96_028568 [Rhipicephalus appendiculatus]
MEVQVNGEDISPKKEFLAGTGWCTIGSKTQVNRPNALSNTQNGAPSRTDEGVDGNRQRSRQQQRNVKQQVIRSSKMPLLPRREDTVCFNNRQNIIVVSTPHAIHAAKYRQLQANIIGDRRHEVSAYETVPDYTEKGIIKGIPLEKDTRSIHTNIVHARNPPALAAKRLNNTTTVIVAFEGPRVPTYVRTKCVAVVTPLTQAPTTSAFPLLQHCAGGTHMTADRNCRARYKTPLQPDEEAMRTTQGRRGGGGRCHQRSRRQAPLKIQDPQSNPLPNSEPHTGAPEAATTPGSQLHTWRDPDEVRQGH